MRQGRQRRWGWRLLVLGGALVWAISESLALWRSRLASE